MSNKNNGCVKLLLVLLIVITAGCAQEIPMEQPKEEEKGTGILVIESSPADAQIYVDGELKGTAPLTLYKTPSGDRNVLIRKGGYDDFEKRAIITPGRTEEIRAYLIPSQPDAGEPARAIPAEAKPAQPILQPSAILGASNLNKVNIEGKVLLYFDFDNNLTTSLRKQKTDVFFKNYKEYLYYTALFPAKLMVIDKPINEVTADDCVSAKDVAVKVLSGQTLCVRTMEGAAAAISSTWETEPKEVEWVLFS